MNLYAALRAFADHATVLIVEEFSCTVLSIHFSYPEESELFEYVLFVKELVTSVVSNAPFI